MKRYEPLCNRHEEHVSAEMVEVPGGEWVRYSDIADILLNARRYEWLRDKIAPTEAAKFACRNPSGFYVDEDVSVGVDRCIDSAMSSSKEGE